MLIVMGTCCQHLMVDAHTASPPFICHVPDMSEVHGTSPKGIFSLDSLIDKILQTALLVLASLRLAGWIGSTQSLFCYITYINKL